MAKWQNDTMLDTALNWLKTNVDAVYICSSQPTTYSEATSTYKLGGATSYAIAGSPGDYASGRQIAVTAKSSIAISVASSTTMAHVALTGSISSVQTLIYVTTIPASSQASVSSGDKVNMAAWNIQLADAA